MSINQQQYMEMRERVEDLLCRVDSIADTLHVTGVALHREEAHLLNPPARTYEDPMMLDSCSQVALRAAKELRAIHEQMLKAVPEILASGRVA